MTLAGKQLGYYRLVRLIGRGGMGEVYLAEDTRLPRQVAVKVISYEQQLSPDAKSSRQAERLFQREMRAITMLDHPHILPLFDFGEEKEGKSTFAYMVMPFRPEGSFTDWLRQHAKSRGLAPDEVIHFVLQAADALQHAHDHHLIHQDVKPDNFLIRNRSGNALPDLLLMDFGIAKVMTTTAITSQGVRGTPTYMAPELWDGFPQPASDQYALAIMTYLLLTGRTPFSGRMEQVMRQHFIAQPQPPSSLNPKLSPAFDAVILRALAKRAQERFATVRDFALALQQAQTSTAHQATLTMAKQAAQRDGKGVITFAGHNQATLDVSHAPGLPARAVRHKSNSSRQRTFVVLAIVVLLILCSIVVGGGRIIAGDIVKNAIEPYYARATATTLANHASATAIALANPDPYPPLGTLAWVDSLSQANQWQAEANADYGGQCHFTGIAYQITQAPSNKLFDCDENTSYSDFAFEVKMRIDQGDCGGLVIRASGSNSNLYFFEVCRNGSYFFIRYPSQSASGVTTLVQSRTSAIKQGTGQVNVIAIIVHNSTFDLYVNAQKIDTARDNSSTQGVLGLAASSGDQAATVTFQDARLWTLSSA